MGIFDFLTGKTRTTQDTSKTGTQDQTQVVGRNTGTAKTTETGTQTAGVQNQTGKVTTLDAGTQGVLRDSIGALSGKISGETQDTGSARGVAQGQLAVLEQIRDRAGGAEATLQNDIQAIIADERLRAERSLGSELSILASQVGSRGNSGVALTAASGIGDVASRLAATQGQLRFTARDMGTKELLGAISAGSQVGDDFLKVDTGVRNNSTAASQSMAQIASILKGAETTSEATTSTLQESRSVENSVAQELQALISLGQGDFAEEGSGSGTGTSSIIDFINVLNRPRG